MITETLLDPNVVVNDGGEAAAAAAKFKGFRRGKEDAGDKERDHLDDNERLKDI